jgi:hypothetical protein
MAMQRTVFSPKCCATSSTSRTSCSCTSSADMMNGSLPPSNCTSTTAPMICVTLPSEDASALAASAAKPRDRGISGAADPRSTTGTARRVLGATA